MRLDKLQAALVRLSVDGELRALAEKDPLKAAAALEVTSDELAEVVSIAGLPRFAAALVNKRLGQVKLLLPRTASVLGGEFDRRFRAWAASRPTAGVKKHQRDAVAFAAELRLISDPAWVGELAAYEAAWVEAGLGRRFLTRRFVARVNRDPPQPGRCLAVWLRWPAGTMRHFAWP